MSTPASQVPPSAGDDRNLVTVDETYVAPGLDDKLRLFWEKNAKLVVGLLVVVVLVITGRSASQYFAAQREEATRADYAKVVTNDQLKAFVAQYPNHLLAGVAELRLADDGYAAGNFAGAQADYTKAASLLAGQPLGQRAQLGAAMSRLQSGQPAEAELKQLAGDVSLFKGIRVEAAYTLAVLAADAGRSDDLKAQVQQVREIEPNGLWAQRAVGLLGRQASTASPAAPAPAVTAPAATLAAPAGTPSVVFPGAAK